MIEDAFKTLIAYFLRPDDKGLERQVFENAETIADALVPEKLEQLAEMTEAEMAGTSDAKRGKRGELLRQAVKLLSEQPLDAGPMMETDSEARLVRMVRNLFERLDETAPDPGDRRPLGDIEGWLASCPKVEEREQDLLVDDLILSLGGSAQVDEELQGWLRRWANFGTAPAHWFDAVRAISLFADDLIDTTTDTIVRLTCQRPSPASDDPLLLSRDEMVDEIRRYVPCSEDVAAALLDWVVEAARRLGTRGGELFEHLSAHHDRETNGLILRHDPWTGADLIESYERHWQIAPPRLSEPTNLPYAAGPPVANPSDPRSISAVESLFASWSSSELANWLLGGLDRWYGAGAPTMRRDAFSPLRIDENEALLEQLSSHLRDPSILARNVLTEGVNNAIREFDPAVHPQPAVHVLLGLARDCDVDVANLTWPSGIACRADPDQSDRYDGFGQKLFREPGNDAFVARLFPAFAHASDPEALASAIDRLCQSQPSDTTVAWWRFAEEMPRMDTLIEALTIADHEVARQAAQELFGPHNPILCFDTWHHTEFINCIGGILFEATARLSAKRKSLGRQFLPALTLRTEMIVDSLQTLLGIHLTRDPFDLDISKILADAEMSHETVGEGPLPAPREFPGSLQ